MGQQALPIGVFDSGVGGLTVVRQMRKTLPREDLIYLGDTARVPYGTKSPETVIRFACEDALFLVRQKVKAIVVACNTASAWALPALQSRFRLPIFGVILPGAQAALAKTRNYRIGVIGTGATVRSQAYPKAILDQEKNAQVFARACPLLVPLVEEGRLKDRVTRLILQEYLAPLVRRRIDTLVLGCTHYPLLKPAIRQLLGKRVSLVDSAQSCAHFVAEKLNEAGLIESRRRRQGIVQPYVTDEVDRFEELSKRFLDGSTRQPVKVDLPTLPVN